MTLALKARYSATAALSEKPKAKRSAPWALAAVSSFFPAPSPLDLSSFCSADSGSERSFAMTSSISFPWSRSMARSMRIASGTKVAANFSHSTRIVSMSFRIKFASLIIVSPAVAESLRQRTAELQRYAESRVSEVI